MIISLGTDQIPTNYKRFQSESGRNQLESGWNRLEPVGTNRFRSVPTGHSKVLEGQGK